MLKRCSSTQWACIEHSSSPSPLSSFLCVSLFCISSIHASCVRCIPSCSSLLMAICNLHMVDFEFSVSRTKYQPADYHLSASTLTPHLLERIGPMESSTSPTSTTQLPPLTKIIRKSSIVGLLGLFLGGLLWCMMQTVQMIHHWRLPGNSRNPLQWPVFEAYLLLGAEICLFVVVTMFASMIPSLIMTWITAVVFNYLFGKRTGRERHEKLVRSASDLAKEMSWTTLKSAVREGNLVGAGLVTLCLGTWLLGTTNLFSGEIYQ